MLISFIEKKNEFCLFIVFLSFLVFFNIFYFNEFNLITDDYQKNPSEIELALTLNPIENTNFNLNQNNISTCLNKIDAKLNNLNSSFIQIGDNIHWYPSFYWNSSDEANFSQNYRGHFDFQFIFIPNNEQFKQNNFQFLHGIELVEGSYIDEPTDIIVNLQFKKRGFSIGDDIIFNYYMDKNFTLIELAQDRLGITPLNSSKFLGNFKFRIVGFYQITNEKDLKSLVECNLNFGSESNSQLNSISNEYRNYYNYIFSINDIAFSIIKKNFSKLIIRDQYDIPFIQKVVFSSVNSIGTTSFQQLLYNIKIIQPWIYENGIFSFFENRIENLKGKYANFWKCIQNLKNLQNDIFFFTIPVYISFLIFIFLIEKKSINMVNQYYNKRYLLGEKPKDFIKSYFFEKIPIIFINTLAIFGLNYIFQRIILSNDIIQDTLRINLSIYFIIITVFPILVDIILLKSNFKKIKKSTEEFDLNFSEENREIKAKLRKIRENIFFGILILFSLIPVLLVSLSNYWIDFQSPEINISISKILIISFLFIFLIPIPLSRVLTNFFSFLSGKINNILKKTEKTIKKLLVFSQMPKYQKNNKEEALLFIFLFTNILLSSFYLNFENSNYFERKILAWDSSNIKLELRYSEDFDYEKFINSSILSIPGIKSDYFTNLKITNQLFIDYNLNSNTPTNCSLFDPFQYSHFINFPEKIHFSDSIFKSNTSHLEKYNNINNSIIVSRALADKFNLNIKDNLKITSYYGVSSDFKIVGIIDYAPLCEIDNKPSNIHILFLNHLNCIFKEYGSCLNLYLKVNSKFNFQDFSNYFLNHYKHLVKSIKINNSDSEKNRFDSLFLPRLYLFESILIGIVLIFCSIFMINKFYEDQNDDMNILKQFGSSKNQIRRIINSKLIFYFGFIFIITYASYFILSLLFYKILLFKTWIQIDSAFYNSWNQIAYNINNCSNWDLYKSYGKSVMILYPFPIISLLEFFISCSFLILISYIQFKERIKENAKSNFIKSRNG
ncbi:hypothetical protein [Candidatus Harpocratesius sp.]